MKETNYTRKFINDAMYAPMLENGVHASKEELIKSHMRIVVGIAQKKYRHSPYFDDIVQEGNIALIKAAENFDPSNGNTFAAYAIPSVTLVMMNAYIGTKHSFSILSTKPLRKAYFNIDKYRVDGELLTDEQAQRMSDELDISIEDIRECEKRMSVNEVSIDTPDEDDVPNEIFSIEDSLNEPTNVLQQLERHDMLTNRFVSAINNLNEREQHIIKSRWLTEEPTTLVELGKEYGVSNQRIEQIAKSSMKKIRAELEEYY